MAFSAMWKTDLFGNTTTKLYSVHGDLLIRQIKLTQFISSGFVLYIFSGIGITAGAHRLWSHRAYKAKFPLRVFLMILDTMAFQVGTLLE